MPRADRSRSAEQAAPRRRPAAARPARPRAAARRRSAGGPPCRAPRGRRRTGRTATPACSRSATVVNGHAVVDQPGARRRPSCPCAAARRSRRVPAAIAVVQHVRAARSRKPARICVRADRPAAGTPPASTGRTSAGRGGQRGQLGLGASGPTTRRRLRAQPRHARARPARRGPVGGGPEAAATQRLGQRLDRRPAGGEAGVQPRRSRSPTGRSPGAAGSPARHRPVGSRRPAPRRDCRCTLRPAAARP